MCVIKFLGRVGGVLGRFAGAERGSRDSQGCLNPRCERVRAAEHPPRDPFNFLERIHGLAEIVERGVVVLSGITIAGTARGVLPYIGSEPKYPV